ncbi:copper chaperone for superoxide dismutase-like [Coccinella septempunctata]|uniref:copper chaperone for superoxide dismutase-like n=1 Tax=Coccinella septempunctata TaxID=41139 RepID=UPI001D07EFA8|nr:copper chaperone for superoxide dismutase-like [Coccinella septempunctata]
MTSTTTEFAVNMTCKKCARAVEESLSSPHINIVDINVAKSSVIVESTLSTTELLQKLETSGRKVVVKGLGGTTAGVAVLEAGEQKVKGVVRFVQLPNSCIVDGTVDGLEPGKYQLSVHENGDISRGCESCGDTFNPVGKFMGLEGKQYGDLGVIEAGSNGRSTFRLENKIVHLPELIGRSLIISKPYTNGEKRIICGIIARSAGLFQNPKTICACSGASMWDEKNVPMKPSL